jgi:hypothetical protein
MKWRVVGFLLTVLALATAVGVYAFSTATVRSAASVTITATGQLLELIAHNPADNPSAMISRPATGAGTGKITIDFGHNGTSSIGIQADSTYTYDNIIRVKNNNPTAKDIDVFLTGAAPGGTTVEISIQPYDGAACDPVSYAANPAAVNTAAGAQVCVSFKVDVDGTVSDGALTLDFTVTAQ